MQLLPLWSVTTVKTPFSVQSTSPLHVTYNGHFCWLTDFFSIYVHSIGIPEALHTLLLLWSLNYTCLHLKGGHFFFQIFAPGVSIHGFEPYLTAYKLNHIYLPFVCSLSMVCLYWPFILKILYCSSETYSSHKFLLYDLSFRAVNTFGTILSCIQFMFFFTICLCNMQPVVIMS